MNHEQVVIERLVVGGMGLARLASGKVVLVPGVIPGEKVRIRINVSKKSLSYAELLEIVESSPHRVRPPCPYYGRCGGCQLQHIAPEQQDHLKKEIFCHELQRSALAFDLDSLTYIPSHHRLGYRQRIRLHVKDGSFGFFAPRSHQLLAINRCLLARSEINEVLAELATTSAWQHVAAQITELEIQLNPHDSRILLIIRLARKPRPRDRHCLEELLENLETVAGILVQNADGAPLLSLPVKMPDIRYDLELAGGNRLAMGLEPGGFCQVNPEQNQAMVAQLMAWMVTEPAGNVLDLFCGMGNFSLPLAAAGMQVTGIDQQRAAIRSATKNSLANGLPCVFRQQAALTGLKELVATGARFSHVVLDPPRAGFKEGCALLPTLQPATIIYISCDQATLLRDLGTLAAAGYRIAAITLVDQFSQTSHLEAMVLLRCS